MSYKDLRLRHINEDALGDTLYVTFAPWGSTGLPSFFGESFFAKRGLEAFCIAQNGVNHWWHTDELKIIAKIVRELAKKKKKKVVLYGSSMGGYAACHYRYLFNSSFSIALAPQIFIDNKYHDEQNHIIGNKIALREKNLLQKAFKFDELYNLEKQKEYPLLVFFDPNHKADTSHIQRYKALITQNTNTCLLEVPHVNHDVAKALNKSGLLSEVLLLRDKVNVRKLNLLAKTAYIYDSKTFMNYFRKESDVLEKKNMLDIFKMYYEEKNSMDFEALYITAESLLKLQRYEDAIHVSLMSIESYMKLYQYKKTAPSYLKKKFEYIVSQALKAKKEIIGQ